MIYEVKQTAEFESWFSDLDLKTKVIVQARIQRIAESGHLGDVKKFNGLLELRWKSGIRVYSAIKNKKLYILLYGGNKNGQARDIEKAKKILKREIFS